MKLLSSRYVQVGLALIVAVLLLTALSGSAAAAGPMYHTVLPGQTLYSIAGWYHVSVWSISCANGIYNPNYIYAGQVLYIPSGGWDGGCKPAHKPPVMYPKPCCEQPEPCCQPPVVYPKPCCEQPSPCCEQPVVYPKPCCEQPEHPVVYPKPCCEPPPPCCDGPVAYPHPYPNPKPLGCYYTVGWGQDLYRIGLEYGVSWTLIAHANGLYNANYIYAGQVLHVPCKVW